MDIQLITADPVTGVITWGIQAKKLTGIAKLVQIVVISLMNVPGQAVLDPSWGVGLPSLLESNINPNDSTDVFAEVARLVTKTQTEVIANQVGVNDPPEELLTSLQIVGIVNGASPDEVLIKIRIINQANQATDIVV